jgi:hypothetical protein
MTNEKRVVETWANRWRGLKAWGMPLVPGLWTVDVRMRHKGTHSTGRCFFHGRRIVVTASVDIVDSLVTILHEFAHAAAPRRADRPDENPHGLEWQRLYAAAVFEVTHYPIPDGVEDYKLMDRAANEAVGAWWKRSGHAFAWALLKGQRK